MNKVYGKMAAPIECPHHFITVNVEGEEFPRNRCAHCGFYWSELEALE